MIILWWETNDDAPGLQVSLSTRNSYQMVQKLYGSLFHKCIVIWINSLRSHWHRLGESFLCGLVIVFESSSVNCFWFRKLLCIQNLNKGLWPFSFFKKTYCGFTGISKSNTGRSCVHLSKFSPMVTSYITRAQYQNQECVFIVLYDYSSMSFCHMCRFV